MAINHAFAPVSAPAIFQDTGESCDVSLPVVDALAVGLSLQALARNLKTPHGTREIYDRVGKKMASAARAQMAQTRALKTEAAKEIKGTLDGVLAAQREAVREL